MLPFKNIYFDSDVLIASGWPELSTEMRNVLKIAQILNLNSILLDPVERELEAHWIREFDKTQRDVAGRAENLARLLAKIRSAAELKKPEHEEVRGLYRARVEEVMQHGLSRASISNRPLGEVFKLAIWHQKPFSEKGTGFQDAVICLSAIEHLLQLTEKKGAFVSKDRAFDQASIDNLTASSGAHLILYSNLEPLTNALVAEVSEAITKAWEEDCQRAAHSAGESLGLLQDFISQNLEVPVRMQNADIASVLGIKALEVTGAVTPFPLDKREQGKPVKLSLDVKIQLHVLASERPKPSWAGPPTLRVGQERHPRQFRLEIRTARPQPKEMTLETIAELEAEASEVQGNYSGFQPISVELKRPPNTSPPMLSSLYSNTIK